LALFRVSSFDVRIFWRFHRHFINVSALISTSVNLPPVYKHGLLCSLGLFSFLNLVFFYFFFLPRPMQQLRDGGLLCNERNFPSR
jgi:hypothetical protein